MDFLELAKKRYSCKKFSDRKIDRDLIEKILEAGRLAPTTKTLQEQRIYVVQSDDGLKKIDGVTPCRYNAPVVLVVAFNKKNIYTYPGGKMDSGVEDATIVATHLCLAATSFGVDNCWLNNFNPDVLHESLGLPEDEQILMLLDLGYAAEGFAPLPNHSSRKMLDETVSWI